MLQALEISQALISGRGDFNLENFHRNVRLLLRGQHDHNALISGRGDFNLENFHRNVRLLLRGQHDHNDYLIHSLGKMLVWVDGIESLN
jgi:hypothetical protein